MNGGILGDFARGQLFPALEAALVSLPEGSLSERVETELGFHLVRCDAIAPEHTASYAEARPAIRRLRNRGGRYHPASGDGTRDTLTGWMRRRHGGRRLNYAGVGLKTLPGVGNEPDAGDL